MAVTTRGVRFTNDFAAPEAIIASRLAFTVEPRPPS